MRKRALTLIFIAAVLLAPWVRPAPAQACTTTPEGQPAPTLQDRLDHATVVFTGTVIAMEGEMYEEVAVVAVSHYFKGGDGSSQLRVGSWGDGAVCRRTVAVGESWLFYVVDYGNGTLHADWYTAGGAVVPPNPDFLATVTELTANLPVTQPAAAGATSETAVTTPDTAAPAVSPDISAEVVVTDIPAPPPGEPAGAVPVPDNRPVQPPTRLIGFLSTFIIGLGLFCSVVFLALLVGFVLWRRSRGNAG